MTAENGKPRKNPRSITGGIGTSVIALGMFVLFIGFGKGDQSVTEGATLLIGLGIFITLCAITAHLFSARN